MRECFSSSTPTKSCLHHEDFFPLIQTLRNVFMANSETVGFLTSRFGCFFFQSTVFLQSDIKNKFPEFFYRKVYPVRVVKKKKKRKEVEDST